MKRIWGLLIGLIGAVVVAGIAAVAIVMLMPSERVAAIVSAEVEKATGRPLALEGGLEPTLWPVLGVTSGPLSLGNADWGQGEALVSAESATFGLQVMPLLSGEIELSELRLIRPRISLEIAADGRKNWDFAGAAESAPAPAPSTDPAASASLPKLAVSVAEIVEGDITLIDGRTGETRRFEAVNLRGSLASLDAELLLEGDGRTGNVEAAFTLSLLSPSALMAGKATQLGLEATTSAGAVNLAVTVDGLDQAIPTIRGAFGVTLEDPARAAALAGSAVPAELGPLGATDLKGEIDIGGDKARIVADGNAVWRGRKGDLSLTFDGGGKPGESIAGDLAFRVTSGGLADVSFSGPVRIEPGSMPRLSGTASAKIANPKGAFAWATGETAPPELADLSRFDAEATVELSASRLRIETEADATWRGRAVALDIGAAGNDDWTSGGPLGTSLRARSAGLVDLAWQGQLRLEAAPSAAGKLSLDTPDLRRLLEWASGTAPAAPAGTLGPASLSAAVDARGTRIRLGDARLRLDDHSASGTISVETGGAKPFVTAALRTEALDLRPFTASGASGGSGSGGGTSAGSGWSSDPIDLAPLQAVDAEISIDADRILVDRLSFGRSRIDATLKGGLLTADIRQLQAYGGGLNGRVVFGGSDTARLSTDLTIDAVQLHPLLKALEITENLEGLGAFRIRVDGQGRSMAALMQSLNGQGGLDLRDGAILGINLAAVARNLMGDFGGAREKTDFSSVTGTFDIRNGVLTNTDFSFLGPLIRITGAGTVGIGAQNQNFTLTPKAVASLVGQGGVLDTGGLAIFPIRITGTWANPRIAPDLSAAIGQILADPGGAVTGLQDVVDQVAAGDPVGGVIGVLTGQVPGTADPDASTDQAGTAAQDPVQSTLGALLGLATGQQPGRTGTGTDTAGTGTTAPTPLPTTPTTGQGGSQDPATGDSQTTDAPASAPSTAAPTPEEQLLGVLGGLLGAPQPSEPAPTTRAQDPLPADETLARGTPDPEFQPDLRGDGEGAAPRVSIAPRPARRLAAAPVESTRQPPPEPQSETTAPEPEPQVAPGPEPLPAEPRRPTPEEEAIRALGSILRGLGNN